MSDPTRATRHPAKVRFTLTLNGKVTLLCLLALPLLSSLGFWQLERAEQKRALLSEFTLQQTQPPLSINGMTLAELGKLPDYQRVSADGQFDNKHIWLIDNKTRQSKVGYEVVQLFKVQDGSSVLVNRGWIQGMRLRTDLPDIETLEGTVTLFANAKTMTNYRLLNSEHESTGWPRVILQVEVATAKQALNVKVAEKLLYLDGQSPAALVGDWKTINIQPEKHTGYAVQWFAMAIALVIWFCFASSNLAALIRQKWGNDE